MYDCECFVGNLYIGRHLDRETFVQYVLNVSAMDGGQSPNSAYVTVIVDVLDVNDNPPVFSHETYKLYMEENMSSGSAFSDQSGVPHSRGSSHIEAIDADSGSNAAIRYELHQHGRFFKKYILENISPFCWAIDTPALEFW